MALVLLLGKSPCVLGIAAGAEAIVCAPETLPAAQVRRLLAASHSMASFVRVGTCERKYGTVGLIPRNQEAQAQGCKRQQALTDTHTVDRD